MIKIYYIFLFNDQNKIIYIQLYISFYRFLNLKIIMIIEIFTSLFYHHNYNYKFYIRYFMSSLLLIDHY